MADTPVALFALDAGTSATALPGAWRQLWRDRRGRIALTVLGILVVSALAAPWLAPYPPNDILGDAVALKTQPPSFQHWFGTDFAARDVFSRMLYGARISLLVAFLAASLSAVVGLLWGAIAGLAGGAIDIVMMRLVDALLSMPRVLLVLTVGSLWPRTVTALVLLLGLTGWFGVSRLARAETLSVRGREFVMASRALGLTPAQLLRTHILPHATGPVLVAATIAVGHAIVLEAGLSFFGVGVQPPTASWGTIIRDGWDTFAQTWWLTLFPGVALVVTGLCVNTIAGLLRTRIDPRQLPGR
jgi:peptide/nickel transport system permease protein